MPVLFTRIKPGGVRTSYIREIIKASALIEKHKKNHKNHSHHNAVYARDIQENVDSAISPTPSGLMARIMLLRLRGTGAEFNLP